MGRCGEVWGGVGRCGEVWGGGGSLCGERASGHAHSAGSAAEAEGEEVDLEVSCASLFFFQIRAH